MTDSNFNDFYKMFGDFSKAPAFGDFAKAPAWDFNNVLSAQRRNAEAFSAVNQTLVEGVRAVSKRQSELARDAVENFIGASKDLMTGNSPENNTAKQAELARSVYESALAGSREISEMASKSGTEAFNLLNERATESLEEFSKMSCAA